MSWLLRASWVGALAVAVLCGCNFDKGEHDQFCGNGGRCGPGERCVQSFCVRMAEGSDAGSDAGPGEDGGAAGEPCEDGQPPEPCYDGAANTEDVGMCRGGERVCAGGFYTQCLGQVLPVADMCNEADDDCDGTIDEIEASCPATGTGLPGICNEGALVCHGAIPVCVPVNEAQNEVCNGEDDDCDRTMDELMPVECFPSGETGCTANDDGTFACKGLCHTGMSACEDGQESCETAVVALAEDACTSGSGIAGAEDCDDRIDEGCSCTTGQTRPCYGGPVGSDSHPPCAQGVQTCIAQRWGDCEGQTLPQAESCQNQGADDDCNGTPDDLDGLGDACIDDRQQGICREGTVQCEGDSVLPGCVGQAPQEELCNDIDENCNGDPYDGHDLNSDENCGECGNRCDNGTHCCNLMCRSAEDFRHDADNCGSCGNECGAGYYCCWNDCIPMSNDTPGTFGGQIPVRDELCGCTEDCRDRSCCGTSCVDLQNDNRNCGACGNDCTRGTIGQSCCRGVCSSLCAEPI